MNNIANLYFFCYTLAEVFMLKIRKTVKKLIKTVIALAIIAAVAIVYFKLNTTASSDFTIASATDKEFHLTAHRGLSSIAPENSAPALEEAGKAGFYAAEFDIDITADGVWIMIHDDTVDRTTNGTGEVNSLTYSEILAMTIDEGNGIENYPDLKISTFAEALEICKKHSMRAMIEVKGGKPEDMQSVLDIIEASGTKNPLIIDFDSERLSALRKLDKDIEMWYLVNKIEDDTIDFAEKNNTGIGFNFGIPKNYFRIKDAQEKGIALGSWTVDFLPVLDILVALDVKYITTNRILP
jgi:glycerophosphoryl diester phosphodiesterase